MLTIDALTANALGDHLAADIQGMFGSSEARLAEILRANARLAIECIANSDALYHDYDHTVLVTLAGRDILRGRSLREAISPSDWVHFLVASAPAVAGLLKVRSGSGTEILCVSGTSGSMRIAAFELRSQACH